jgi:hypothetical protein
MAEGSEARDAKPAATNRTATIAFGAVDIFSAILVYVGVFEGLPARYWPVDCAAALIIVLFAGAGGGLLADSPWAARAARATSMVSLVLGLSLVSTLALTASYLSGIYGPVGRGGALILALIAALALPYLVVLPLAQLIWLGRRRSANAGPATSPTPSEA